MCKISYNDLTITGFPTGEHIIVYSNNIDKYPDNTRDYFSKLILRDTSTNKLTILRRNIKEIPALPLGSIIRDQKLTTEKTGDLYNFYISVNNPQPISRLPSHFFNSTSPYFLGFDAKISTKYGQYNVGYHSKSQTGITLKKDGNTIFFPSYVIAQYFYFRSASLIKQLFSATHKHKDAVKGLYKEITISPSGECTIILMPGTSPNDAPEIFRFAVNPLANYLFNELYPDLVKSHFKIKEDLLRRKWKPLYNSAILQCFFPVDADLDVTFRGVKLSEDYYLALEIIQENSDYPFEYLTIYIEDPKRENRIIPIGRVHKKFRAQKITDKVTKLTPNSKFEDIKVMNEVQTDGRYGLIDKIITNEKIIVKSDSEITKFILNMDECVDLNSNHDESSGDEMTVKMNPAYNNAENPTFRTIPDFDDFKKMLFISTTKNKTFSFILSSNLPFPQKPLSDLSRKKWLRSFLKKDDKTPRAYLVVQLNYNGSMYTLIEIEKDDRIPKVSTLILRMDDYTLVSDDIITSILVDYVKEERSWIHRIIPAGYTHSTLIHPHDCKNKNIEDWGWRLVETLNTI